jgi:hypothetical protein
MGASSTRAVYEHFLTQQEAQQLLFIHRALAVNGYRPHVRSLTLFDLVLAEPRLLPPLVRCWAPNHKRSAHGQTTSATHSVNTHVAAYASNVQQGFAMIIISGSS